MIPASPCCNGQCVRAQHPEWTFCDVDTQDRPRCHNRVVPGETRCSLHGGRKRALAKVATADLRDELARRPS